MKYGDLVNIKLTSEIGMVIEVLSCTNTGYVDGYLVRVSDYQVVKFADFEVEPRKTK